MYYILYAIAVTVAAALSREEGAISASRAVAEHELEEVLVVLAGDGGGTTTNTVGRGVGRGDNTSGDGGGVGHRLLEGIGVVGHAQLDVDLITSHEDERSVTIGALVGGIEASQILVHHLLDDGLGIIVSHGALGLRLRGQLVGDHRGSHDGGGIAADHRVVGDGGEGTRVAEHLVGHVGDDKVLDAVVLGEVGTSSVGGETSHTRAVEGLDTALGNIVGSTLVQVEGSRDILGNLEGLATGDINLEDVFRSILSEGDEGVILSGVEGGNRESLLHLDDLTRHIISLTKEFGVDTGHVEVDGEQDAHGIGGGIGRGRHVYIHLVHFKFI
jgi:hypothetical protein